MNVPIGSWCFKIKILIIGTLGTEYAFSSILLFKVQICTQIQFLQVLESVGIESIGMADFYEGNMAESSDSDSSVDSSERVMLSMETLDVLKQYAMEVGAISAEDNSDDILSSIQMFFDEPDKEDTFIVDYTSLSGEISVYFEVKGIKRELGQTLSSTGLTMYVSL
jgi:hypothetical protein